MEDSNSIICVLSILIRLYNWSLMKWDCFRQIMNWKRHSITWIAQLNLCLKVLGISWNSWWVLLLMVALWNLVLLWFLCVIVVNSGIFLIGNSIRSGSLPTRILMNKGSVRNAVFATCSSIPPNCCRVETEDHSVIFPFGNIPQLF